MLTIVCLLPFWPFSNSKSSSNNFIDIRLAGYWITSVIHMAHSRPAWSKCKETSNLMWMSYPCIFTHIWWIWIHRSMHCDFFGSDGLQKTHMDAFKPFNSKLVTLTMRGGFFTKFSALAHGEPSYLDTKASLVQYCQKNRTLFYSKPNMT